jgi:THO complex subunit 4
VGRVKKSGLNFNEHGKSKGTAEVIYASRADALKAIKTYNGVKLDGKPLRIDLVGGAASSGNVLSSGVVVSGVKVGGGGGRQARVVVTGGNKGPVAARGMRKVVAKVVPRPHAAKKPGDAKGKKGGRGKKGPKPTPMTAEQLDAQLDSYKGAAAMQE